MLLLMLLLGYSDFDWSIAIHSVGINLVVKNVGSKPDKSADDFEIGIWFCKAINSRISCN